VFVFYESDLEDWLTDSTAITYADDTPTSTSDNDLDKKKKKMEHDAEAVLRFMVSNGLIANAAKTSVLILNLKNKTENKITIKIGTDTVTQEIPAKLLGMTFEDTQQ
jgi:hypothetical protein